MSRKERRSDDIPPPFEVEERPETSKVRRPGRITEQARRAQRDEEGALKRLSHDGEVEVELRAIARRLLLKFPDITVPEEEIAHMALDVFGANPPSRDVSDRGEFFQLVELNAHRMVDSWRQHAALFVARDRLSTEVTTRSGLDKSASRRYLDGDTLTPLPLPAETPPEQPPAQLVEELRAENARLRSELEAANALIDARQPTEEQGAFEQPPLDDVPHLTASSLEDLWEQFRERYGGWLTHFGAEQDRISLDHIRRHDPRGLRKLSQKISKARKRERDELSEPKTPTLGQIMPTESDMGDLALAGKTAEEILADRDLGMLFYGRLRRHLFGQ